MSAPFNIRFNPAGENCPWRVIPDEPTLTLLFPIAARPGDEPPAARKAFLRSETAAGERIDVEGYGRAYQFRHEQIAVADIEALADLLMARESHNAFAIRGTVRSDAPALCNRRLKAAGADILDRPSYILCIDIDNAAAPADLDLLSPMDVGDYIRERMPAALRSVSCVVQLSNSHAMKPGIIKAHLWYLLDAPVDGEALRRWMKAQNQSAAAEQRVMIDPTTATACQPLYFAAPVFTGMADPLPARIALLLGEADTAHIDPPAPAARTATPATGATRRDPAILRGLAASIRNAARDGLPRHPAILAAAFTAGGYVAGGAFTIDEARAALLPAALESGSNGAESAVESSLQAGMTRPLYADTPADDTPADDDPADADDCALGEKSDLAADLVRLHSADINNAYRMALAIARRYSWQCPRRRTFAEFTDAIVAALPDGVRSDAPTRIRRVVAGMEAKARASAMKPVSIDPAALADAGVKYERIHSLAGVAARIQADPAALYLVKAAHGTGKTELVLKPLARTGCAVAITNRVALVADLCQRLNLANYQKLRGCELESCNALGVCLPSITNPKFSDVLSRADSVLVDEVSAVLAELHTTGGTLKKSGPVATATLINVINNARVAVGVDADVSTRDALLLASRVSRPVMVLELPATATGATVEFADAAVMQQRLLDALADGQRCRVACDSSRMVTELAAMIRRRFPALNVVAIHSRPGDSTAGAGETINLLSDINNGIGDVDVLIHSPTVESGVSLVIPHFQRSFGFYCGRSIAPAQFIQMLRRDRTAQQFEIGFAGAGVDNQPTSAALILAAMDSAHRRTVELASDESGAVIRIEPASAWDKAAVAYRAQTNEQRNNAIQMLLLQLEQRGFTVKPAVGGARIDKDARTCAKQDAAAHYADVVLSANVINHDERSELERRYQPAPDESAAMERYDAALENGVAGSALSPLDLQRWQHGRLRRQYRNYARLRGPATPADAVAAAAGEADALAHRSRELATIEAVQTFFDALGIDRQTGNGDVDASVIRDAYQNLAQSPVRAALEAAGICRFNRTPKYPVRWLNDALGAFGLELEAADANERQMRSYRVAADATLTKAGDLKMPGWDAMADIHHRRTADEPLADAAMADAPLADESMADGRCDDKEEKIIEASAGSNVTYVNDEAEFKRGVIERLMADGWERRNATARATSDWIWRHGSPAIVGLWQMRSVR